MRVERAVVVFLLPLILAAPRPAFAQACGDAILDFAETCDDGNTSDGDGCSALCQIEPGFECTAPVPPEFGTDVVLDGSFELGTPNPQWTEVSLNFDSPLCSPVTCSLSGASEGDWWAWFGGSNTPETASIEQTLTIPATADVLRFDLWQRRCDSDDDALVVTLDGAEIARFQPCVEEPGYAERTADISAYADDMPHLLRYEAQTLATNGGATNFFVDSVELYDNVGGIPPVPSMCTPAPELCTTYDFGPTGAGSLAGWITFNTGPVSLDWGTTDDGFCGSGTLGSGTPAPNVTGGTGEAACVDTDANGFGAVEAWLCSPLLGADQTLDPELRFRYNYQLFGTADIEDGFAALVGTAPPDATTVGGYSMVFEQTDSAGGLLALPGADAAIALSAEAQHVCFRYAANFDYYAQLDDVELRATLCDLGLDPDQDGLPSAIDNCAEVPNADQRDTDADGFGNACDADLDNDCNVNFQDLALMKAVFFESGDLDSDLDGDGVTNFADLAILKAGIFQPPGPSGLASCSTRRP